MNEKVLVVGLGEIGLPVFRELFKAGIDVSGYDSNMARGESVLLKHPQYKNRFFYERPTKEYDIYVICVPCDKKYSPFIQIMDALYESGVDKKALISIECTLPHPRLINNGDDKIYSSDVCVFPHRIAPHEQPPYNQPGGMKRVLGANSSKALSRAYKFWGQVYGYENIVLASWKEAILSKICENAARYVEIALAEEIAMLAEAHDVNPYRLIKLINTKWNMDIKTPLDGIGRHCLPKDVQFARDLTGKANTLFHNAIHIDERYKNRSV